jgi:hypothetical protein
MKASVLGFAVAVLATGCVFDPDWSSYPACGDDGACPTGSACLKNDQRCVPTCAEPPCDVPDAGTADGGNTDAGTGDAGTSDGGHTDGGTSDGGALALSSAAPAPGIEGTAYSHSFSASGGSPPYTFTLERQTLPAEFTLDPGGKLTATAPAAAGTFGFGVVVSDGAGQSALGAFELVVLPLLRMGSQTDLPSAITGQAYREDLYVSGGGANRTFTLVSGSLPPGVTLTPAGVLSGTPSAAGNKTFLVRVEDDGAPQQAVERTFLVPVTAGPPLTLSLANNSLAYGRAGEPYLQRLSAYGGTGAHTFAVTHAPPGLSISSGALVGTPTTPGTYANVTVRVTSGTSVEKTFTVVIH